jgi:hypothetical protein
MLAQAEASEMAFTDAQKLYVLDKLGQAYKHGKMLKEKAKAEQMVYLNIAESAVSAGVVGFLEGRMGQDKLRGIPIDLALAGLSFGTGFMVPMKPETSKHLYAIGTGALSVYLYKQGKDLGTKSRTGTVQPAMGASSGPYGVLPPHTPSTGLSDAELSRLIAATQG